MTRTRTLTGLAAALLSIAAVSGCGSGSGWFDTSGAGAPQLPEYTVTETAPETETETPKTEHESPKTEHAEEPYAEPYAEEQTPPSEAPKDCFATYQTKQSHVQLCEVWDQTYYYGSSAVGSIVLPAHLTGTGTYETEANNGYVYTVNSEELVITRDGELFSHQPVTSSSE